VSQIVEDSKVIRGSLECVSVVIETSALEKLQKELSALGRRLAQRLHAYQGKDNKVAIAIGARRDASASAVIEVAGDSASTRRIEIYQSALVLRALASSDGQRRIAPGLYTAENLISIGSRTAVGSLELQKQRHLRSDHWHLAWVDRGFHDAGQPCLWMWSENCSQRRLRSEPLPGVAKVARWRQE